jgi:hypothetical protein
MMIAGFGIKNAYELISIGGFPRPLGEEDS